MRVRQTFRRRSRKESRPGEPTARPHNAISDQPETTDPETMPEQTIPLPADVRYFTPAGPFRLECGAAIPLRIAYHTYGTFTGDNALWVCHALTANSEVADWWPHTVEAGKFLDPARWFTVCANIVGSCYGTTGPASPDPATGKPYYGAFPSVTVRDMARANLLLADHLGIAHARAVIGSSIGGFQALEMALERPGFARKLILIATAARAQPWTIAADEAQRMALEADTTFGTDSPDAGRRGMEAARAIGLLTYRGSSTYNATQQEHDDPDKTRGFRACSYQRHQGEKLSRRFDAYSYRRITEAFDSHNVGRGRGGVERALGTIGADTLVVGITSDIILPVGEQLALWRHIPHCRMELIVSDFGHDGFLVEHAKLDAILGPFIES